MQRSSLSPSQLSALSNSLSASLGLHFPQERQADLERGVMAAARQLGHSDVETCVRRLLSAPLTRSEIEILASYLTVGETYFFRESASLQFFAEQIVPELLRSRDDGRPLRIWSAGCCTGEEPYSIAILLDGFHTSNVTILATDINPRFIRKAAAGAYSEWSFRLTPPELRHRYFQKRTDGQWELSPRIRRMVTFSHLNLATDVYPSLLNDTNAMDVIFCRNVLMYFSDERMKDVVENFYRSLVPGGWLIVSAAETSNTTLSLFRAVQFSGGTVYRKTAVDIPSPAPQLTLNRADDSGSGDTTPSRFEIVHCAQDDQPITAEDPHDLLATARSCANEGKLAEAARWCERAIAADRTEPFHHYLLSTIQRELGQAEAAVHSLTRALFLDSGFVLAHFGLANLELSRGRTGDAQRHLRNALAALRAYAHEEVLPESDGLTAGRLAEIITSVLESTK